MAPQSSVTTSIQLYTVRELLGDLDAAIDRLAEAGFQAVEAFDFVRLADPLRAALERSGLGVPTGHGALVSAGTMFRLPDGQEWPLPERPVVFDAAASLGMGTVIDPMVAPDQWSTLDAIVRTADALNEASVQAAAYGLRVGYHNHGFELAHRFEGRTALEVLADSLDPAVVLEVDLYWATRGGADAPALVNALAERVVALHVKDGTLEGTHGEDATGLPAAVTDQVVAGQGVVPLAESLAAATELESAVIEFDEFDGDVLAASEASLRHLEDLLSTRPLPRDRD